MAVMRANSAAIVSLLLLFLSGCVPRPEAKLVGKWQSDANKFGVAVRFEFLRDGNVIKDQKTRTLDWKQLGAGTFKFIDPEHVKVELQPNWYFGTVIYEVTWSDKDHLSLRAGDETIQLVRLK